MVYKGVRYADNINHRRRKAPINLEGNVTCATDKADNGKLSDIDVMYRVRYYLFHLEKLNIPKEKWPVALLMIIHLHGRQFVLPSSDIKYRVAFRKWISQDAHDWERLEQLRLLQKLCKIFDLNDAECVQNYKEYIKIWGDKIESKEEYNFWNRKAKSILSDVSGVQVQIELYKCWKKCLCPITETLSYTSASYLHKGGYKKLYKTKGIQEEIDRIIASEENEELFQKSLGEYQARLVCSNGVKDIEKIVEKHFAKIDSAKISELINQCGLDEKKINRNKGKGKDKDESEDEGKELERLLTESVFRKILWNKARKKLADQVKRNLNIDFTKMEKSLLRGESL